MKNFIVVTTAKDGKQKQTILDPETIFMITEEKYDSGNKNKAEISCYSGHVWYCITDMDYTEVMMRIIDSGAECARNFRKLTACDFRSAEDYTYRNCYVNFGMVESVSNVYVGSDGWIVGCGLDFSFDPEYGIDLKETVDEVKEKLRDRIMHPDLEWRSEGHLGYWVTSKRRQK